MLVFHTYILSILFGCKLYRLQLCSISNFPSKLIQKNCCYLFKYNYLPVSYISQSLEQKIYLKNQLQPDVSKHQFLWLSNNGENFTLMLSAQQCCHYYYYYFPILLLSALFLCFLGCFRQDCRLGSISGGLVYRSLLLVLL